MSSYASSNKKALKAYKKYLSKSKIMVLPKNTTLGNYPATGYQGSKSSGVKFALAYLDKDNIPELFVVDYKLSNVFGVFSYIKGKVIRVGYSRLYEIPIAYYKGEEYFYSYGEPYFDGDDETYCYYKLYSNEDGIVLRYFHDTGNNRDNYYRWYGTPLSHPMVTISRETFNSLHEKYCGGKAPTKLKFFKNTAKNRKKRLK